MIDSTQRFREAIWYSTLQKQIYTIVGAGNIGSWLALFISRMNPRRMLIYDFDSVDEANISGQHFTQYDLGQPKNYATVQAIKLYSDYRKVLAYDVYEAGALISEISISCADSMNVRRTLFEKWCELPKRKVFIDTRSSVDGYEIYFVTPKNQDKYLDHWFPQEEATEMQCTTKATTHVGAMCAADVVGQLSRWGCGLNMNNGKTQVSCVLNNRIVEPL
jgi:hypothetical protein